MVDGVEITAVTADIVGKIAALESVSFSDPWSENDFNYLTDNENVLFNAANIGGHLVGYLILLHAGDAAELANLAVDPAFRRAGIGGALLDGALAFCRGNSIADVALEVRESNAPARALYVSRGFREVGRRRVYYRNPREDAIIMLLRL